MQDELGEAAQVPDGGRELLDVVVAEVQLTKSWTKVMKESTSILGTYLYSRGFWGGPFYQNAEVIVQL